MLLNNRPRQRQTQPGAFTNRFGGEKWLEDALLDLWRNAIARIRDSIQTRGPALASASSVPVRIVIVPLLSIACAAFTSKFMMTWLSSDARQCTLGRLPYALCTSALYLISCQTKVSVVSMP